MAKLPLFLTLMALLAVVPAWGWVRYQRPIPSWPLWLPLVVIPIMGGFNLLHLDLLPVRGWLTLPGFTILLTALIYLRLFFIDHPNPSKSGLYLTLVAVMVETFALRIVLPLLGF